MVVVTLELDGTADNLVVDITRAPSYNNFMKTITTLATLMIVSVASAAIVDRNRDGIPDSTREWSVPEFTDQNIQGFRPSDSLAGALRMAALNMNEPDPFGDKTANTRTRPLTPDQKQLNQQLLARYKQELEAHLNNITPEPDEDTLQAQIARLNEEYVARAAELDRLIQLDGTVVERNNTDANSTGQSSDSDSESKQLAMAAIGGGGLLAGIASGVVAWRRRRETDTSALETTTL